MLAWGCTVSDLLSEIGYEQALRQGCKTSEEAANRVENVGELVLALSEHQQRAEEEGIAGFLSEISLDPNVADEASEEECRNPDHDSCRQGILANVVTGSSKDAPLYWLANPVGWC
jgi:superfamily I DNA/RNA helicase